MSRTCYRAFIRSRTVGERRRKKNCTGGKTNYPAHYLSPFSRCSLAHFPANTMEYYTEISFQTYTNVLLSFSALSHCRLDAVALWLRNLIVLTCKTREDGSRLTREREKKRNAKRVTAKHHFQEWPLIPHQQWKAKKEPTCIHGHTPRLVHSIVSTILTRGQIHGLMPDLVLGST